jgi:multicomponent Na+:H+ antiporter subunit G
MINETIGYIFIFIGCLFDFFGVLGLLRLPDVYNRLQAATKCVTFGSAGILFGIFLIYGFTNFGVKALIGIVFIFLTSPAATHAIARAAHISKIKLADSTIVDKYAEDHELLDIEESESSVEKELV